MLEIIKKRIIKLIKHDSYTPVKVSELAKSLGVPEVNYPRFEEAFEQLKDAGHVVIGPGALVTLPTMANRITGTFRANSKGFGFIVPLESNSYGDLFVAGKDAGGAMNGDIVSAKVIKQGKKEGQIRYGGIITEILERSSNKLVGTLQKDNQGWFIRPDGSAFLYPIYIDDVTAKNARLKDKVVVEIVSYQSGGSFATGVIIEVLGKAGRYDSEIKAVMRQYNLPENFDDVCLKQATKLAADFSADNDHGRQDITDKVYDDGFGSQESEFNETQTLFHHLIEEQQPYCSSKRSESDFYRLFSAVEAVPLGYAAAYDECIQSGRIYDAMKYVVPLTLGQYHKLKSEDRASENKDRIVIDAKYDPEIGLLIGQRDHSSMTM